MTICHTYGNPTSHQEAQCLLWAAVDALQPMAVGHCLVAAKATHILAMPCTTFMADLHDDLVALQW
ncbi:MAG: hypothetical protein EBZ60_00710 [Betaproteobacteria bacterium]|nr:hypothetical protein [Betaproteobacteria bacterium]